MKLPSLSRLARNGMPVLAAALPFFLTTLSAQTEAASPTSDNSADAPKGEVVELSRFEVRSSSVDTYNVRNATAGLKTIQPLIDIAAPIQVLPRSMVEDLGFNWLTTDYARFVSSGLNSFGGNNQFFLRGQRVTPMFKDGVQYYSSVDDDLSVETVEVVKGVNSSLFGSLPAVSGMVMESAKIPQKTAKGTISVSASTPGGIVRGELDTTGPLSKPLLGATVSYRLLLAGQQADMKQIQDDNRVVFSPSVQFDWKTTSLRVRYEYSDITDFGLYTNNFLDESNHVSTIGGRDQTYKAPWSRSRFKKGEFETNLMTKFSPDVEGRLQIAYFQELRSDHDNRAYLVSSPSGTALSGTTIIPVNANSVLASTVLQLAQTQTTIAVNDDYVANFNVAGSPQQTNFGFGVDYLYNSQGLVQPVIGHMSVINPVLSADPGPQAIPGSADTILETKVGCLYLQDQAKFFSERLILTAGANWGWNEALSHKAVASPTYLEAKGSDLTYKFAAVWKASSHISGYASQATAFVPQGPGVVAQDGSPLPPISSTADELGLKTDGLFGGKIVGSIAYYSSKTTNQPVGVNAGTASFYNINGGQTTTHGMEYDVTVKPTPNWDIIATAFEGAGVTNSAAYLVGGQPVKDLASRSFKETWSFLTKYRFTSGPLKSLMVGFNAFHMGSIYMRPAPALPASTRYSVFASYAITKHLSLSVNVDNVTDAVYCAGGNSRYALTIGAPRTFSSSLKYKF